MPESDEAATIRCLPDGTAQTARLTTRTPGRLELTPGGGKPMRAIAVGALVEIDTPAAVYLGEVIGLQKDSQVTVAVEHFIDRAALEEIDKVWRPAEGV